MGFDHYHMGGPTFAPHPHAGFSAVSYVFENSAGGLRNRDSLGHDLVIHPGEMVWTQAGSGVVHDEFPAESGREVHGVQVFVNLAARNKSLPPLMLHGAVNAIPAVRDSAGNTTRVLSGQYADAVGPIKPGEPFDFFDVRVLGEWRYTVQAGRNLLLYVLSGAIDVVTATEQRSLREYEAIAAHGDNDELQLRATTPSQVLALSGIDHREPVAVYGPFIMNTPEQLAVAFERYRSGGMGRLAPLTRAA